MLTSSVGAAPCGRPERGPAGPRKDFPPPRPAQQGAHIGPPLQRPSSLPPPPLVMSKRFALMYNVQTHDPGRIRTYKDPPRGAAAERDRDGGGGVSGPAQSSGAVLVSPKREG